ncbi:MAG: ATP-binding protein [Oscillospiraceae bacterium]|nr:ATP-binding protein [Oscillospiraceae bacterium]
MTEHQAIYAEQPLPEFKGNPLIEALPPILLDSREVIDMLSTKVEHHDGERQFEPRYRMQFVLRLFRYFQPLEQHLDIEERFSKCIRQGYIHRSPLSPDYAMSLAGGHKIIKSGGYYLPVAYSPTGSGFTIIGLSGVGKTSAVTRVLSLYPQVIVHSRYHDKPLVLKQIVWLKLECPHDGSVKGLCMEFFGAVDRAARTNYFEMYAKRSNTIDLMMQRMEQIARLHCVGVLVIDETQHLRLAKGGGSEKMLNFLVSLVNKIGIPVVLIGTTPAKDVLQSEFRQARRSSGILGDLLWDRMDNDGSWDIFCVIHVEIPVDAAKIPVKR